MQSVQVVDSRESKACVGSSNLVILVMSTVKQLDPSKRVSAVVQSLCSEQTNLILVRKHRPRRIDLCLNMPSNDDLMEMSCSSFTSALLSRRKSHPFLQPNVRLADHHKHMPQHHASGLRSLSSERTRDDPTSCANHLLEHTTHLVRKESSGRLVSAECQHILLPLLVEMQCSLILMRRRAAFVDVLCPFAPWQGILLL